MTNESETAGKMPALPAYRTFIAIEIPSNIRTRITEHIDRLRREFPEVRASWSREENLHLTVKFLGDIPVARVAALSNAAQRAARTVDGFELIIGGCGTFPLHGQPRVLWIGIEDPSVKLAQLQQALEDQCAVEGFAREQRAFHPHLTIARLRKPQGSRRLGQFHTEIGFKAEPVAVSELAVIRSELRSEGSKHTVISRHGFGSSPTVREG